MKHVALLRGINVGGNNLIPMAKLKASIERLGFTDVTTYIQSGNVIFEAPKQSLASLTARIEQTLSADFTYDARVVVVSHAQMKAIVDGAPRGFGTEPAQYRYDVIFIKPPLTTIKALKSMSPKEGVDFVTAGKGAVYFSRAIAQITKSRINKIVGTPEYKFMTIRNWNTTTKLLALMEKAQ